MAGKCEPEMSSLPLFIRDAELEWEGWGQDQKEARGNVIWKTLFSRGKTASDALTAGIAVVPPDGYLSPHRHSPPEIYYILDGEGVIEIEKESRRVGAGTAIFIPGNARHGISNPTTKELRFLYAFAVDSFDEVVYLFESE